MPKNTEKKKGIWFLVAQNHMVIHSLTQYSIWESKRRISAFFLLRTQTFKRLNSHRYLNLCARVIIFLLLLLSFWGSHLRCCCYYEFFLKFRFHSTEDSYLQFACIFTIFVGAHNFMCYKLMCQILRFYNHIDRFIPLVFWYMFIVNCIENAIYLSIMHINIVCNAIDGIFNVYLFRS